MENENKSLTDEEKQTIDFISKMELYDEGIFDFYTDKNDDESLDDFSIIED